MKGSVRVMRSFDYCHFEVTLSSEEEMDIAQVNEMRKEAAILVDEAIGEYREAKKREDKRRQSEWDRERNRERYEYLQRLGKLSVEEEAELRQYQDRAFWDRADDAEMYSYSYDPEKDYHFSVLRAMQNKKVSVK